MAKFHPGEELCLMVIELYFPNENMGLKLNIGA
jgi:hypothetical protein